MPLPLRYYQKQAVQSFFHYVDEHPGKHPVIVIPTAGGKSLVQAYIIRNMLKYDNTRILCLTHQKELIKQNYNELVDNFDNDLFLDAGIYSAGLKRRDTYNRILFAGIQSVYKKAWDLGFFDLIIVDEAHLISPNSETMFRIFFAEMEKINPKIVICGMSATPYRMKDGLIIEGEKAVFDDFCHETPVSELINADHINNHDHKQYLCPLVTPEGRIENKVDLTGVHIRGGEYVESEMQAAYMVNDLTQKVVQEIINRTQDRHTNLIFTAGIDHCEEVTSELNKYVEARCIHSKKNNKENDQILQDYRDGKFKYLINVNSLTTGFNYKPIDCIALLRSTLSPGLYCQMGGRGLRLHESKEDCLILDFGRNIERHGPIDKIQIKRKKDGTAEVGTMPMKECPGCQELLFLAVMECPECGYIFPQKDKHDDKVSDKDIISTYKKPETLDVTSINFSRHYGKPGKQDTLRVDYHVGLMRYSEWVCIEHEGFAGNKAKQWLAKRTNQEINTIDEAVELSDNFRQVESIIVNFNEQYPKIIGFLFEDQAEYEARIKEEQQAEEQKFYDDIPW